MTDSTTTALRDGFDEPQVVDGLALAFGGDMSKLLPPYSSIPDEFKRHRGNKWVVFQSAWFFKGIKVSDVTPRDDVDAPTAWAHLKAIQASWEPKHEHKEAAVAWLASRWFADVREGL